MSSLMFRLTRGNSAFKSNRRGCVGRKLFKGSSVAALVTSCKVPRLEQRKSGKPPDLAKITSKMSNRGIAGATRTMCHISASWSDNILYLSRRTLVKATNNELGQYHLDPIPP